MSYPNLEGAERQIRVQQHATAAADARLFFDALIVELFTEEQAMALVVAWFGKQPGIDVNNAMALIDRLKADPE